MYSTTYTPLFVPAGSVSVYQNAFGWNKFTIEALLRESCATPVITVQDNQLFVACDTEGAKIYTSIVANDQQEIEHKSDEPITLSGQYLVT